MKNIIKPVLNDIITSFGQNADGVFRRHDQEIPEDYLSSLKQARDASGQERAGEYHRVASIPVALVEQWMREGYDVFKEPIRDTVARLKREGLDAFVTTQKRI